MIPDRVWNLRRNQVRRRAAVATRHIENDGSDRAAWSRTLTRAGDGFTVDHHADQGREHRGGALIGDQHLLLEIDGVISETSDVANLFGTLNEGMVGRIREELDRARSDDQVKAVVVRINSPGGTVTGSDLLYDEIQRFKQERKVPVIAQLMGKRPERIAAGAAEQLGAPAWIGKGKLTADEAVQVALLNSRELQALYSDLGVAQADLVQAGLLRNPIFDAAVLFPVTHRGRPDLEMSVVINFLEVVYMPLRKRVAAARFEEAKTRLAGSVIDFAARVQRAFYLQQSAEQMLELRQTIVEALSASLEVVRRLHEAGNIGDLEFARQRAQLEGGRLALRSAEVAVRQSREDLNTSMGLWGKQTEWQSDLRLPDIPEKPIQTDDLERVVGIARGKLIFNVIVPAGGKCLLGAREARTGADASQISRDVRNGNAPLSSASSPARIEPSPSLAESPAAARSSPYFSKTPAK